MCRGWLFSFCLYVNHLSATRVSYDFLDLFHKHVRYVPPALGFSSSYVHGLFQIQIPNKIFTGDDSFIDVYENPPFHSIDYYSFFKSDSTEIM
jgi:hypothetical protein